MSSALSLLSVLQLFSPRLCGFLTPPVFYFFLHPQMVSQTHPPPTLPLPANSVAHRCSANPAQHVRSPSEGPHSCSSAGEAGGPPAASSWGAGCKFPGRRMPRASLRMGGRQRLSLLSSRQGGQCLWTGNPLPMLSQKKGCTDHSCCRLLGHSAQEHELLQEPLVGFRNCGEGVSVWAVGRKPSGSGWLTQRGSLG